MGAFKNIGLGSSLGVPRYWARRANPSCGWYFGTREDGAMLVAYTCHPLSLPVLRLNGPYRSKREALGGSEATIRDTLAREGRKLIVQGKKKR